MKSATFLQIGSVGIAAVLALPAPGFAEPDPAGAAQPGADSIGEFHHIRNVGTGLCLQPLAGSTGDVPLVTSTCDVTLPEQNWIFVPRAHGLIILNQKTGKCVYNNAPLPLRNASMPIIQATCGDSNTLWKPSVTEGIATLMSLVQFRDTGFCLSGDNPLELWSCDAGTLQAWVVGLE